MWKIVMEIFQIAILIILGILSVYDIIYNEVPLIFVIVALVMALVSVITIGNVKEQIPVIVPGVCLIIIGVLFSKEVGIGDGLVLIVSELIVPIDYALLQIEIVAFITVVVAIIFIVIKKKIIPLIPIIVISHLVILGVSKAGGLLKC